MTDLLYSDDDCEYRHSSAEEAAEVCASSSGDKPPMDLTIYEGEATYVKASDFAPCLIDHIAEQAYGDHGEFAEDWPNMTTEEMAPLQEAVEALIDRFFDERNHQPRFGHVKKLREIQVHVDENYVASVIENTRPAQENGNG